MENGQTPAVSTIPKRRKTRIPLGPPGIKWRIFGWLALFTAIILTILWLCQTVFLDDIYKLIKISEIRMTAAELIRNIDSPTFETDAEEVARGNDLCLMVLKMESEDTAREVLSVMTLNNCAIHNTDRGSKFVLYDLAKANGGSAMTRYRYDSQRRVYVNMDDDLFDKTLDAEETMIYTVITHNRYGDTMLLLLNSVITPVSATIRTLNIQLTVISAVLLLIALLMALLISRSISKPLTKLTDSAKQLARGNYGIGFSQDRKISRSCREIAELASTLDYAADELSKVETLRRELIANISHDLRTPLTMIEGYGEVMRDLPGENTPENVQIIIDEAKRLSSLVNDVLDLSRIQSGAAEFVRTPLDITELVSTTLTRYNKLCEADGYRIYFNFDTHVIVEGDVTRLGQVIYNLVGNAVTYTGADKTVRVTQAPSNGRVRISVTDSGEGIPEDKLEHIWDRYYKGDKAHRRASVGTGLGLSIVKSVMDQHGGSYGVDSVVGQGSTFWVELDVAAVNVKL
nr:HAMP domain-containing histidine kinase [Clostridia bacterium]